MTLRDRRWIIKMNLGFSLNDPQIVRDVCSKRIGNCRSILPIMDPNALEKYWPDSSKLFMSFLRELIDTRILHFELTHPNWYMKYTRGTKRNV